MGDAKRERTFTIDITCTATLGVSALWPDGDAPENPTAADVEDLIERDGGYERIIGDWNLDLHGQVQDDEAVRERMAAFKARRVAP